MTALKKKKLGPIIGCRLTENQHKKLAAIAAKSGASFAEVLRRKLDIGLKGGKDATKGGQGTD